MADHLYGIGEKVFLTDRTWTGAKVGSTYLILATLPDKNGEPQYRVKNEEERFERVVAEYEIIPPTGLS
jgi:hypothetical protein